MTCYAQLLGRMMDAILSGDVSTAKSLFRSHSEFTPEEQLSVYAQGYRKRLHGHIGRVYGALQHYMGKDAFHSLADDYIRLSPSRFINIEKYAAQFGQHVSAISNDIFAEELACLEHVLSDLQCMPDTLPLQTEWLELQSPGSLTHAPLKVRAAACLLAFAYPVSDYRDAYRKGGNPAKPQECVNWLIVLRNDQRLQCLPLEEAEFMLLTLLSEGHTLATAFTCESFAQFTVNPALAGNFERWFSRWVNEGIFQAMQLTPSFA